MEKFAYSDFSSADLKLAELKKDGVQETATIENVPEGSCIGKLVTTVTGKGKTAVNKPIVNLVTFDRKDDKGNLLKLAFMAVTMDVLHVTSAKSYNNLLVKASPEVRAAVSNPANLTKDILLNSVASKGKTYLQFESISK